MRTLKTPLLEGGEYNCLYEHIGLIERASAKEYGRRGNFATKYISQILQFSKSEEFSVWEQAYLELEKWLPSAKGFCLEPVYSMAKEELQKLRKEVQNFEKLMDEEEFKEEFKEEE